MSSRINCLILISLVFLLTIIPESIQSYQDKVEDQGFLKLGESQEKTISPGIIHAWNLSLEAHQYAVVEVQEKSIDVVVRIVGPMGELRREINNLTEIWGTEKATWITDMTGTWKVEITPSTAIGPGVYEVKLVILRKANDTDRQLVKADSLGGLVYVFFKQGNYSEAEQLCRHSLDIRKKYLESEHIDVANSLGYLGLIYQMQDKHREADSLYKHSLEIREKLLGPEHPDVAVSLGNLGDLYQKQGKYIEAEPFYKRSLAIREKSLGPEHPYVARSLDKLATLYYRQGKYAEAELLYKRSLTIREKTLGPEHSDVAHSLDGLCSVYSSQGKYNEAEQFCNRSLDIKKKTLGSDHIEVGLSLNSLAIIHERLGNYAKAEPLYRKALEIYKKALGPEHSNVAIMINNLAWSCVLQGKYNEAEPLYKQALEIYEKTLGQNHPNVAASLTNLGWIYFNQGKYDDVEPLYIRALTIWENALGMEHPDVAQSLAYLAWLYQTQGKYSRAEPLFSRALAIHEKALGLDHPDVAGNLANLAMIYNTQCKYTKAEMLIRRALRIYAKVLKTDHPMVAYCFEVLADIYFGQANYNQAEPLYKRSLAIREKTLGTGHQYVAQNLNKLARLYYIQAKYAEAEPLYLRALAIFQKVLGLEHAYVAQALNNLAALYYDQRRYAEAEPLYKRSLAICEKTFGPNHPEVALRLSNLGMLYLEQGKYIQADTLFKNSLRIFEEIQGLDHPNVTVILTNQAYALFLEGGKKVEVAEPLVERAISILDINQGHPDWRMQAYALRTQLRGLKGDLDGALNDLDEAWHIAEELRPQAGGGEVIRATLFKRYLTDPITLAGGLKNMVSLPLKIAKIEKALEYVERCRARSLLDQLAAGKIDLRSSIPLDIRSPLESREIDAKARLTEYQQRVTLLGSRKDLSNEEKSNQIAELQDSLRIADREYQQVYEEIKNASPLWRDLITSGGQPVLLATIQRRLIPKDGLMLIYHICNEESFLFIIPHTGKKVEVLNLNISDDVAPIFEVESGSLTSTALNEILIGQDTTKSVAGLIKEIGSRGVELIRKRTPNTMSRLHALWQILVPDKLWQQLKSCSEVIVIPDGALHLLPFEALVVHKGYNEADTRYWLDEGPPIRYVQSATTLYNIEQRPDVRIIPLTDQPKVLSLSNPIYDPSEVAQALLNRADEKITSITDSVKKVDEILALEHISKLTRDSYQRIGGSLSRLPGTARETEEIRKAFRIEDAMGGVLDLMGLEATELNLRKGLPGKQYIHLATHGLVDQKRNILFSALALTPPPAETDQAENDGFLQLYEIYDLKLDECELAVLSACQTNIGEYIEGEGVFALSRGFLAAGARRVIASQWSVDDISTAEIMGTFFRQIAEAEKKGIRIDYARALRDAKLKVRNQQKWVEPYYWAPFVLMGKE